MKLDYNKINLTHQKIYNKMKEMGLDIELKKEYEHLNQNNFKEPNKYVFEYNLENESTRDTVIESMKFYENISSSFSFVNNMNENESDITIDSLMYDNNLKNNSLIMKEQTYEVAV
ncbi:hypothetical protein [Mammaliicoccus sciuri]|uniref:hypothetical protein n=1 Tax=Mammaliicoccus sciuri TaxID=1296 RepID=UPI0018DE8AA1|nr:hypothetical protein [Mammaliicoccus sciuri]QPW12482.1 hypothetical protein I7827_02495 [Mammaliicoccus sciuri]